MSLDRFGNYVVDLSHPPAPASSGGGSGSPQGVVVGSPFQQWVDTDTGTLYIKTSGVGTNTGWTSVSGGGGGTQEAFTGSGSPEGAQVAITGQFYWDSTNKVLYVKGGGTGNTGWQSLVQVTS